MAPTDISSAFQQRLRWAMGALQILLRTNPLLQVGAVCACVRVRWRVGLLRQVRSAAAASAFLYLVVSACTSAGGLSDAAVATSCSSACNPNSAATHTTHTHSTAVAAARVQRGLTPRQALMFFEGSAYPCLSLVTIVIAALPLVYLFTQARVRSLLADVCSSLARALSCAQQSGWPRHAQAGQGQTSQPKAGCMWRP